MTTGRPGADTGTMPLDQLDEEKKELIPLTKLNFTVQFAWVPVSEDDRPDEKPNAGEAPVE